MTVSFDLSYLYSIHVFYTLPCKSSDINKTHTRQAVNFRKEYGSNYLLITFIICFSTVPNILPKVFAAWQSLEQHPLIKIRISASLCYNAPMKV